MKVATNREISRWLFGAGIPPFLEYVYSNRPCWICGAARWCEHREPEIDLAEIIMVNRSEMEMVYGAKSRAA